METGAGGLTMPTLLEQLDVLRRIGERGLSRTQRELESYDTPVFVSDSIDLWQH